MKLRQTNPTLVYAGRFLLIALCLAGYDLRQNRIRAAEERAAQAAYAAKVSKDGTIGVSYDEAVDQIGKKFPPFEAISQDGQTHYVTQGGNGIAKLELVGDKANLTWAKLWVSLDAPLSGEGRRKRNALPPSHMLISDFFKNTFPEWPDAGEWALFASERAKRRHRLAPTTNDDSMTSLERSGKVVRVDFDRKEGMVQIWVRQNSPSPLSTEGRQE